MRNKEKIQTEEIFYSNCCVLCEHFLAGFSSVLGSNEGYCVLRKEKVFSHNWCTDFYLDKEVEETFELER